MSDVFEYLGSMGFMRSVVPNEDIDFDPFFETSQRRMCEAFGEGWIYGIEKSDDENGFLVYRKKMTPHFHKFKCYCGEKRVVAKNE